mmetsp:Transcript_33550/g.74730  ORF Transcript_33550/g.74730 Transcript_33550/m.74730 type:complete len:792 (-) Transcript_33550:180-2555(-)
MMKAAINLPDLLKKLYSDNSRSDVGPPTRVMKELEDNILVLSEIEISDDDVPVICKFLSHAIPCQQITKIQVDRSSGRKGNQRRTESSLNAHNSKLLRELFRFIGTCSALHTVCFCSVDIPLKIMPQLGKALVGSTSDIRWLAFRDCDIGGDDGLRVLTHYLGQMQLQVLGLEMCDLSDASLVYITSILKAQQNHLDSLYWNATLRVDPSKRHTLWNASEIDAVYRQGLVVLSLYGNRIEGRDMYQLTRVLRGNHWLLGLNLAENNIERESMLVLVEEMLHNTVMQAVLLKGNPGLCPQVVCVLHAAVQRNTLDTTVAATCEVVEDLEGRHSSGSRRLELQPPAVMLLLRNWQTVHAAETLSTPPLGSVHEIASDTSAPTVNGLDKGQAAKDQYMHHHPHHPHHHAHHTHHPPQPNPHTLYPHHPHLVKAAPEEPEHVVPMHYSVLDLATVAHIVKKQLPFSKAQPRTNRAAASPQPPTPASAPGMSPGLQSYVSELCGRASFSPGRAGVGRGLPYSPLATNELQRRLSPADQAASTEKQRSWLDVSTAPTSDAVAESRRSGSGRASFLELALPTVSFSRDQQRAISRQRERQWDGVEDLVSQQQMRAAELANQLDQNSMGASDRMSSGENWGSAGGPAPPRPGVSQNGRPPSRTSLRPHHTNISESFFLEQQYQLWGEQGRSRSGSRDLSSRRPSTAPPGPTRRGPPTYARHTAQSGARAATAQRPSTPPPFIAGSTSSPLPRTQGTITSHSHTLHRSHSYSQPHTRSIPAAPWRGGGGGGGGCGGGCEG